MTNRFNESNYSFIIETVNQEGEHLCYWRIDQSCASPNHEKEVDRLHGQVNRHIHGLGERTGCKYAIILSGPKDCIDGSALLASIEVG